jgi:hypothetical protein
MIAWASGVGMAVRRDSSPLRGVRVLTMPYARLDTTRHVESVCVILLGTGVLRLFGPGAVVG